MTNTTSRKLKGPGGQEVVITRDEQGLWRDADGCIYAFADPGMMHDSEIRAGVGWFSLPKDHWMSKAAVPHDFMYSSLAYQLYNSRLKADESLYQSVRQVGGMVPAAFAFWMSRLFGHAFWEGGWSEVD